MVLAALLVAGPAVSPPPSPAPTVDGVAVKVSNPLRSARGVDTVVLKLVDLLKLAPALSPKKTVVVDGEGNAVESQFVDLDADGKPDELVFQSAFAAGETRKFVVRPGDRHPAAPEAFKVYGRFARERHDDFAWENDLVAHRMYGPDLETWKAEPLVSSGVDVWSKRVRKLVVNDWYMTDDYHRDNGQGADLYSVGKSRGCGGLGIWAGDALQVSRNFTTSRVLANGPIRLVFELDYAPWDAGGGKTVSETKRVTLDAGKHFNRFESVFKSEGTAVAPLVVGIGIAKHEGGAVQFDKKGGWLRSWEPLKMPAPNGNLGCALVTVPALVADNKTTALDNLMIVNGRLGGPITYYVGSAWDRGGNVADVAAWTKLVEAQAHEIAVPLRIALAAAKVSDTTVGTAPVRSPHAPEGWAARTCDSIMADDPTLTDKWSYEAGVVLQGCLNVWAATRDAKYFDYVKHSVDHVLDHDGTIKGYRIEDYNLDNINMGKLLFPLLAASTDPGDRDRYRQALQQLRSQLKTQPRTSDRAFWHKLIYPRQMWLDGVYMASPFLAQFAAVFNEPSALDDAVLQVLLAEKHMRDPKSGLLYHGWDESKEQRWANPQTGTSSQFWGRAMGWYAMAVVDVLEQIPQSHPQRDQVLAVLRRLATAIASVQDKTLGLWWQVLDAPARAKNFTEASASSMFVYALGKGIKNGWLDAHMFGPVVARGYRSVVGTFAETGPDGRVSVKSICKVAGLGGNPYRDGSFDYYTSTEVVSNDLKGLGAFILAGAMTE